MKKSRRHLIEFIDFFEDFQWPGRFWTFLDRPASPETIDFPLIFLDPGRESNGKSPTRGPIEKFKKSYVFGEHPNFGVVEGVCYLETHRPFRSTERSFGAHEANVEEIGKIHNFPHPVDFFECACVCCTKNSGSPLAGRPKAGLRPASGGLSPPNGRPSFGHIFLAGRPKAGRPSPA